jgi:hypothetical protein
VLPSFVRLIFLSLSQKTNIFPPLNRRNCAVPLYELHDTTLSSCLPVGHIYLTFGHYPLSFIIAIPVTPTPGSKTAIAGDSRRRQALTMLLDALGGLITDEVPLAVGKYFQFVLC